ncbi:hypothetical protein ABE073_04090 [Lederbergia citrisecunda]|uniref:hypothetical protein n=1 Tax=Lederbergia citrisecunda TaxID=2833583 RepID=UPI003D2654F3
MLKAIVMAMMLLVSNLIGMNTQVSEMDELWFVYNNEDGTFWLEYGEEMDVIHFIGYDELEEWNVDKDKLKLGTMMIGAIDEDDSFNMKSAQYVGLDDVPSEVRESIEYNANELEKELD